MIMPATNRSVYVISFCATIAKTRATATLSLLHIPPNLSFNSLTNCNILTQFYNIEKK